MRRSVGWMLTATVLLPGTGCLSLGWKPAESNATSAVDKPGDGAVESEFPASKQAEFLMSLGTQLEKKGDTKKAITSYEQARGLDPLVGDKVAHRLAVLYDKNDQSSKAATEYERALKLAPKNPKLLNDYGYHCYCQGHWAEAEKHFRQALALDSRQTRARTNLGLAPAQQGRDNEALEAFREVVGPAEALTNLGFILLVRGQKEDARAAYKQALMIDPQSQLARAALAKLDGAPAASGTRHESTLPLGGRSEPRSESAN